MKNKIKNNIVKIKLKGYDRNIEQIYMEGLKKMYTTIIFDLDGTLLNTLEDLKDSVNYALTNNGYPQRTLAEIRQFVGNGVRKLMERAVPHELPEKEFEKTFEDFKNYYQIHCNDKTGPYEGIPELLKELKKRGYRLGIASNKNKPAVKKLNELYFEGIIEGAAGVEEGVPTKPNPKMMHMMMEELECDSEHTLYIGDSEVDVQTARNAGLDMVTVLWGFRDREFLEKEGAEVFAESPMEILNFL